MELYFAVNRDIEIYVPLEGLIDFNKEAQRLKKSFDEMEELINKLNAKLSDENFIERAKPELVEIERNKLKEYINKKGILIERIDTLSL